MIRVIHILNPTAYKEREEMEGQDEKEKKDREDRVFVLLLIIRPRLDTLGIGWQLIDQGFRAVGQHIAGKLRYTLVKL
ncbi:hypothetical protein Tco_1040048 [Tanacetum coccineum]